MKIMLPLDEDRVSICPSFGRAPFFLMQEGDQAQVMENPGANEQGGAGLCAAQFVVDSGAEVLLTPRCGENAAQVLQAAEIRLYRTQGSSAGENLNAFAAGRLEVLEHFHGGYHGIR